MGVGRKEMDEHEKAAKESTLGKDLEEISRKLIFCTESHNVM